MRAFHFLAFFRAFQEQVGPRILSLERVDNFGTSEHFSGQRKEES